MNDLQLSDQLPQLTQSDLEQFEKEIGSLLPSDYSSFLMKNNGGEPDRSIFSCEEEAEIAVFYGISYDENAVCANPKEFHLNRDLLPQFIIPIGDDSAGDLLCLSIGKKTFGQIFWWCHELSDGEYPKYLDEGNVCSHEYSPFHFIAGNFGDFVKMLREMN